MVAIGGVAAGQLQLPSQEATPGQPVRLPPRPPYQLAGREALLAQLDARLAASDGPVPRTVALCGLGGAGKTSLAAEYAYRHLAEVGVAWQFGAENATVLAGGFSVLAAQLGVRGLADTRDPVTSVHAVLARFPVPWLLIFDNAADMAAVAESLPPAGPGQVLITSQNPNPNPNWPGQVLDVPVLNQDVAAGFLVSQTDDPDRQAAEDLADLLGGLPLALEQAAAYVQAREESLAGYLALFRQWRGDLLARGGPAGSSHTVATTWRLAFEDLQQAEPGAVGLLRLLAFCAPEAIPVRLLLQPRPELAGQFGAEVTPVLVPLLESPFAPGDAIEALRRYSLVTPASGGSVSVHRLVQAVTADQMPAGLASQWHQAAAALIEAAIPDDSALPETWPVFAALLPHAQAALYLTSGGMWRFAEYLGESGSFPAARDLFQLIADAYLGNDSYGAEHRDTLAARGQLARWTGQAGNPAAARDLFADLLPMRERVSGPDHPDTLTARHGLASWTADAGDPAAGRDLLAALLPVRERVLGPDHPDTLDSRHELAYWIGDAGDPAAARDMFAALLEARERISGPEHPDTMAVRHSLAYWIGKAGDPAAARDQFAGLLPVRERALGPAHPDTLMTRSELAGWTGEAGDPAGARDQFAGLLPVRERALGPDHPDALNSRHGLAYWTAQAGDWAAARDQFASLLPIHERVLGPEHPRTLADRSGLAVWTGQAGDAAGARDQFAALVPIEERVLGVEHPETLADRANLAYWTGTAGDAAGARDQLAALLPVMERVSRADHPYTLAARARLAYWTGAAGDAATARDQYTALLPVIERVWGPEHPETLIARGNLAIWTGQAGDAAAARDQLAALLQIRGRVSFAEDPDTLTERARLAHWTGKAGDATGARDQYAALLLILNRVLGPEHPETQAAQGKLAYWIDEADRDVSRGTK